MTRRVGEILRAPQDEGIDAGRLFRVVKVEVGNVYLHSHPRATLQLKVPPARIAHWPSEAVESKQTTNKEDSMARKAAAKKAPAKKAAAKTESRATALNVGSTWLQRNNGAEYTVVAIDEKAGTIQTVLKGSGTEPTTSKLVFFRRRFQHVKG
jgi:hypothetical protein